MQLRNYLKQALLKKWQPYTLQHWEYEVEIVVWKKRLLSKILFVLEPEISIDKGRYDSNVWESQPVTSVL